MSLKPADTLEELFMTYDPNTGSSLDADSLPTAVLTHNGTDDYSVALSVSEIDAGRYVVTGTIPSSGYASGDSVQVWVAATVSGVAAKAVIASYVLDGKRVSDLQDASVAAIQSGLGTSAEIAALQTHGDSKWAPDNSDIATILGDVGTTLASEVAAIKTKTDNLPVQPAAIGSQMDLVDNPNGSAAAALAGAVWNTALTSLSTAGSIGSKLAGWVLGTDDKVLLSSDAQVGVTIPTVSQVTGGVELDSSQDIYPADVEFVPNDTASCDEYTVVWFHNGTPLAAGITAATIEVTGRSDGTDLVAAGTAMSAVGSSGALKHDEPNRRLSPGDTAIVTVSATIDGATRTWRRLVMRADS